MESSTVIIFILFVATIVLGVLYGLKITEPVKKCEECLVGPTMIGKYRKLDNTDISHWNIPGGVDGSFDSCKASCDATTNCTAFVMDQSSKCYLKHMSNIVPTYKSGITSYQLINESAVKPQA